MALFQEGNQMYKFRLKNGRFKEYTPEEWSKKINEFFEYMSTQYWEIEEPIKSGELAGQCMTVRKKIPLTMKDLAVFAEIDEQTIRNYSSNKPEYSDYFDLTTQALNTINSNQVTGAILGVYNANIVARLQGLKEEVDHTTNGKELNTLPVFNLNVNSGRINFANSEDEVDA
jgi:hypothetical protein